MYADCKKKEAKMMFDRFKTKTNTSTEDTMFNMQQIGNRIASLRKAKDLTQQGLADKLAISFQAVSNWERGESMPDISKLVELSEILDVSVDELLTGTPNSRQKSEPKTEPVVEPKEKRKTDCHVHYECDTTELPDKLKRLVLLAPFMDEDDLSELVLNDGELVHDKKSLLALAPFLSENVSGKIAEDCIATGDGDLNTLYSLVPFMAEEDISKIARNIMASDK